MGFEIDRDEKGRFAGQPPAEYRLRGAHSSRATSLATVLRQILTPELAAEYWKQAWDVAYSRKSPRSMVQVLELGLSYAYGKPKETIELETGSLDLLAIAMSQSGPLLPPRREHVEVIDAKPAQLLDNDDAPE